MDLATLAAAQQGVKALLTLAKGAASAAVDHSVKDKLIEIQQGILDAQGNLGDAVAERLALLQENAELAGKVRELEAMKAKLDEYVLAEVQPGKFLYESRETDSGRPDHYACPRCYSGGTIGLIQRADAVHGITFLRCSVCTFNLETGTAIPLTMPTVTPYRRI